MTTGYRYGNSFPPQQSSPLPFFYLNFSGRFCQGFETASLQLPAAAADGNEFVFRRFGKLGAGSREPAALLLLSFPQLTEEVFQAVGLDLVNNAEHPAELAFREAFVLKPENVRLGQLNEEAARVFAEGHARMGKFQEKLTVGKRGFHNDRE
jgi:hypothetical protein